MHGCGSTIYIYIYIYIYTHIYMEDTYRSTNLGVIHGRNIFLTLRTSAPTNSTSFFPSYTYFPNNGTISILKHFLQLTCSSIIETKKVNQPFPKVGLVKVRWLFKRMPMKNIQEWVKLRRKLDVSGQRGRRGGVPTFRLYCGRHK